MMYCDKYGSNPVCNTYSHELSPGKTEKLSNTHQSARRPHQMRISYVLNHPSSAHKRPNQHPGSVEMVPRTENQTDASTEQSLLQKRKKQSEKKRQWRMSLTPEAREKRQQIDARRKREQRRSLTPQQRAEVRRKDALRKAAKRKMMKQQLYMKESHQRSPQPDPPPLSSSDKTFASSNRV